jgi:predicted transposase/invertase (TIGR01784 family)
LLAIGCATSTSSPNRLNKEDKATYLRHLDNLSNQKSVIFTAKDEGIVEGLAKGKAEGMAKGMAKGMEEGLAKGKSEGLLQVAMAMKANGEPIEKIMGFTGLTKAQIAELSKTPQ